MSKAKPVGRPAPAHPVRLRGRGQPSMAPLWGGGHFPVPAGASELVSGIPCAPHSHFGEGVGVVRRGRSSRLGRNGHVTRHTF